MLNYYDIIMNSEKNPLRRLPPAQRFQCMVLLSVMWSTVFCLFVGEWLWYGELVLGHVAVLTAIFITGFVFHKALKS